jgi:DNA-nicking Smr family endonuclease
MGRRGKDINVDEEGLWALVAADITPLKGRKKPAPPPEPAMPAQVRTRTGTAMPKPPAPVPASAAKGRDVDRRTEQKLTRGQMDIEAVIDLHGHGQAAAYEKLQRFLQEAYRRGYRCVLVITGKGKDGSGVLRKRLPEWIDEAPLKDIVLKAVPARQADGGHGAWYLMLRRRRDIG